MVCLPNVYHVANSKNAVLKIALIEHTGTNTLKKFESLRVDTLMFPFYCAAAVTRAQTVFVK